MSNLLIVRQPVFSRSPVGSTLQVLTRGDYVTVENSGQICFADEGGVASLDGKPFHLSRYFCVEGEEVIVPPICFILDGADFGGNKGKLWIVRDPEAAKTGDDIELLEANNGSGGTTHSVKRRVVEELMQPNDTLLDLVLVEEAGNWKQAAHSG